jgi:hypothetical protein
MRIGIFKIYIGQVSFIIKINSTNLMFTHCVIIFGISVFPSVKFVVHN